MAPHLHHHHQQQSSSSPASPKGQHYATTLDLARRLGLFDSKYPAQLKGGINRAGGGGGEAAGQGMDWNELLRKFRKHNPNRNLTAQTALVDQLVHSLLFTHSSPPLPASSSSLPPLPPLIPSAHRPQLLTALETLQSQLQNGGTKQEVENAKIVLGFGSYVVGQFEGCLRSLEGGVGEGNVVEEGYDWTLRVLGNAVKGFSIEQLGRPLQDARECYKLALRAYEQAIEHLGNSGKGGTRDDVSLHRIGETVLYRLCNCDNLISSPQVAYTSHLLYIQHSSSTPHAYPPTHALSIHSQFRQLSHSTQNYSNLSLANKGEESILRNSTTLPRAGEVNIEYLRFLDGVNEGWKRGGCRKEDANQVIEIMYNALTHTFQSQRLLRYLVRSLTVAERYEEAGKALKLYFELWEKARETDAKGVAREMKSLRRKAGVESNGSNRSREGTTEWVKVGDDEKGRESVKEKVEEEGEVQDGHDMDSDREFIELGSFGVRLLCRYLEDPGEALRLSRKMKEVFEEGKEVGLKEDRKLNSLVEMAMGISLGALAAKDANPELRPEQHASSLSHLESAANLFPTFHTLYSLSYALFELRQISRALEVAREAVRINKRSKLGWHLLGLLCTARKDMQGALQVFETALEVEDPEEEVDGGEDDALAKLEGKLGGSSRREEELEERWNYPVNETEILRCEVQLRLSKNTVIEYLEGPAAALEDQKEILSWFSMAYIPIAESIATSPPASAQTQSSLNTTFAPPTEGANLSKRKSLIGRRVSLRSKRESSLPPPVSTHLTPPPGLSPSSVTSTPYASVSPTPQNRSVVDLGSTGGGGGNSDRSKPNLDSNPLATRLLCQVWLSSAASFRRAGKLAESKGAVWEAEQLDQDLPEIWSALASIHLSKGETKLARSSLQRAFSYSIDHLPSLILFSRLYLTPPTSTDTTYLTKQLPFAEALLDTLTKKKGWDCPEAWFELSRCYRLTGRLGKEKECLVWALQLEETRAVREREKCLDRIL